MLELVLTQATEDSLYSVSNKYYKMTQCALKWVELILGNKESFSDEKLHTKKGCR